MYWKDDERVTEPVEKLSRGMREEEGMREEIRNRVSCKKSISFYELTIDLTYIFFHCSFIVREVVISDMNLYVNFYCSRLVCFFLSELMCTFIVVDLCVFFYPNLCVLLL